MATAILIDLSNFDTHLVQSTQGRGASPDGNIYFDKTNGTVEFITKQELPQIDLGSGLEDNPLDGTLGIKLEALYAFEGKERVTDEVLRGFKRWTEGSFKFAGSYSFINSRKPALEQDRKILRGSGWTEYAADGGIDRIYFGNKGLSTILATSQPYYQLAPSGPPVDFAKLGQFDEAVQIFGSTANTPQDIGAGDFDSRTYEAISIRTFGQTYDRKETTTDLSIAELGPYSTGFAVSEATHHTTNLFNLADVYGIAQIAPWTGMALEQLDTPQVEAGFNESDGTFTWVLHNTLNGSLDQCIAYLDALAQTDDDINIHITNVTNGKRVETWYKYGTNGIVVTKSGADTLGLFIENIPTADEQKIYFTDDTGGVKTRPFTVGLEVLVGAAAKADPNAWYHCFFASDYNTINATTVLDAAATPIKGSASLANANNKILSTFDYDGDTVGGASGTDKDAIFLCEGNGGATQAKTLFTFSRVATIAISCQPAAETNM